jgi:hypothetical protein
MNKTLEQVLEIIENMNTKAILEGVEWLPKELLVYKIKQLRREE